MNLVQTLLLGGMAAFPGVSSSAADIAGQVVSGANGQKREAELKEGTVTSHTVSFVEWFSFQGNDLRLRHAGKVSVSELSFTREVGEFAEEEFK